MVTNGKIVANYNVVKNNAISFSLFCAENYMHNSDSNYWWDSFGKRYTTEELYNKFIDSYDTNNI